MSAPIQSTATLARFTISVTVGKVADMSRAARIDTAVSSRFAAAKRSLSSGSRVNARTTRTPAICSRNTVLTRSMRVCICWNAGVIRTMMNPSTTISIGMATSRTIDSPASSRMASTVPITIVNGAAIIIVAVITMSSCTCWTSFVIRVISDGAPKWLISRAENSVTRRKIEPRTSRPNPIATLAPNHIAPAAKTTCTSETASMIPPTRQIVSRSPTSTPSSIKPSAQCWEQQGGRGLGGLEDDDEDDGPSVVIEVGAQQADEVHGWAATPWRNSSTISSAGGAGSLRIG